MEDSEDPSFYISKLYEAGWDVGADVYAYQFDNNTLELEHFIPSRSMTRDLVAANIESYLLDEKIFTHQLFIIAEKGPEELSIVYTLLEDGLKPYRWNYESRGAFDPEEVSQSVISQYGRGQGSLYNITHRCLTSKASGSSCLRTEFKIRGNLYQVNSSIRLPPDNRAGDNAIDLARKYLMKRQGTTKPRI